MMVDDLIAIEAMPSAEDTDSAWSGVKLVAGARFIPAGDVFTSAAEYQALRPPKSANLTFDFDQADLAELLGSAYSLKHFRFPISSKASDVSTFMVGKESRRAVTNRLPGFQFRHEGAHYFCSQLIVEILIRKSILPRATHLSFVFPIGLYKALSRLGWVDVTTTHYPKTAESNFLRENRERSISRYSELIMMSELNKRVLSHEEIIRFGDAVRGKVFGDMSDLLATAESTLAKMEAVLKSFEEDGKK
jgi:hypothetical protein